MSRLKSRKLWAWIVWTVITTIILFAIPDSISIALPLYGVITGAYIGTQGIVDAIAGRKGK